MPTISDALPRYSEVIVGSRLTRRRERQADFLAAQVVEIADTVREGKRVRISQKDGTTEDFNYG